MIQKVIDGIRCKYSSIITRSILIFSRAKCGNGFDDATLEKLQNELKPNMTKISKNPNQIPKWFNITRELVPDFIVIDPKKSPVWEITVNI